MKKTFLLLLLTILLDPATFAQKATLHFTLANTASADCDVLVRNDQLQRDYLKKARHIVLLNYKQAGSITLNLNEPQLITLYCDSSSADGSKLLKYTFFLSPGDDVYLTADFKQPGFAFKVKGKGANNNQPLLQKLFGPGDDNLETDSLPYKAIATINQDQQAIKKRLQYYIRQYKPSAQFVKTMQYNAAYYSAYFYYSFKEENKYAVRAAYKRNIAQWNRINDSLFAKVKLNNADAFNASLYNGLLGEFLLREKERLWNQRYDDSVGFYNQWFNADVETGKKLYEQEGNNILKEKIINRYFTGVASEYLYALIFDESFADADPANIILIYNRFKQKFPRSRYIAWFQPSVVKLMERDKKTLSSEMVFLKNNGTDLNTLADVLALAKGKTVLLDMWGSWCGPCRSEMDKNGEAIKAHFKNKGLDYFYVANNDLKNEPVWKKLIAYFNLTGTHILASKNLSNDIMTKVNGTGYPTYVVIKKDGTYAISKAGYPMKRDVLIKQLEEALASK